MNEPILLTYAAYVVISVALTIWVAHTLHKNGRAFLIEAFRGDSALADSVNHLLVVGFYLINLGFVSAALSTRGDVPGPRAAIELLSGKLGAVLAVLGAMHFFNLFLFATLRRRGAASARYSDDAHIASAP